MEKEYTQRLFFDNKDLGTDTAELGHRMYFTTAIDREPPLTEPAGENARHDMLG